MITRTASILIALALLISATDTTRAQSVLERTPNLHDGWVGEDMQFNFIHRMWHMDIGGERRLVASPTFLLGAPIHSRVLVAAHYATSSEVAESNEWEVFGRWAPIDAGETFPVGVALTAAYNAAAESGDAELAFNVPLANLTMIGVTRFFANAYDTSETRMAFGAGLIARATTSVAFAGDVVTLTERRGDESVVWSAALQFRVPHSPHTMSVHATNAPTTTLQGSSNGDDVVMWSFEFTVPLTFF